jgi:molecular chaperone DnaK (HSP70)
VTFSVKDKADEEAAASTLSVSEVTTRYIRRLVGSASDYLGKKVTSAVISVPTNFSDKQKEALTAAARAADVEVLQLVADPAAAILAYDARPGAAISDKLVVVADLGGTRSDVAVVASRGGMYTILATAHDYEFAGVHLDNALMEHFAKEFLKKHSTAADPRDSPKGLAKLRLESEATKRALSLGTNATFSVESLSDGIDFALTINRTRFEMVGRKVFEGFNRLIESVVKKAELDVLDIDEIILAGGTSNIPRVAANLVGIFPATTKILAPSTDPKAINPSELQVRGAALQASLIYQYEADDIEQASHAAVTTVPHTSNAIGVLATVAGSDEETFVPVIVAETAVPARRTVQVAVPGDGGDVLVKVVEGGTHIKVTKPEPKPKAEKAEGEEEEEEEDSDEEEEEEEDLRERIWKVGDVLAEAAVRGTAKGAKVEVTINMLPDLSVTITAREVGAKGGVRGTLPAAASA